MSRFIRLTDFIINKNFIHHIDIQKNKFIIHLTSNKIDGIYLFCAGQLDSSNTEYEMCKYERPNDYKTIANWIHNDLL